MLFDFAQFMCNLIIGLFLLSFVKTKLIASNSPMANAVGYLKG